MSASMQATLLPNSASATARLAVAVVLPTPPLPEVIVITRAVILCYPFRPNDQRLFAAPLFGDNLPPSNIGDLRLRPASRRLRADGDVAGDAKLHRAHVQRAHNGSFVTTRAGVNRAAQASPDQDIATGDYVRSRINIAD